VSQVAVQIALDHNMSLSFDSVRLQTCKSSIAKDYKYCQSVRSLAVAGRACVQLLSPALNCSTLSIAHAV
jgi:hypothetical protein